MLDTEGEILKDADFNILVFEIRVKGYFETRFRFVYGQKVILSSHRLLKFRLIAVLTAHLCFNLQ